MKDTYADISLIGWTGWTASMIGGAIELLVTGGLASWYDGGVFLVAGFAVLAVVGLVLALLAGRGEDD